MYIKLGKPKTENYGRILTDFYQDVERVNGQNIFHKIVLKKLANNEFDMPLIYALDKNYVAAYGRLGIINAEFFDTFLGMYADNGKIIAHSELRYKLNEDGYLIAEIDGLHIYEIEDFLNTTNSQYLKWVYGVYSMMIEYAEEHILKNNPDICEVNLVSTADDPDFWSLVKNYGYHLTSSEDDHGKKLRFTKKIREKGVTYERRYSPKQD